MLPTAFTAVWYGILFAGLFSPAWDAIKLILKVGLVFPFVDIDPTELGETNNRALC